MEKDVQNNPLKDIYHDMIRLKTISLANCYSACDYSRQSNVKSLNVDSFARKIGIRKSSYYYNVTSNDPENLDEYDLYLDPQKITPDYFVWSFRVLVATKYANETARLLQDVAAIYAGIREIKLADMRHYDITDNLVEYCLTLSTRAYPVIIANKVIFARTSSESTFSSQSDHYLLIKELGDDDLSTYSNENKLIMANINGALPDHGLDLPFIAGINDEGLPTDPHYFDNVVIIKGTKISKKALETLFKEYSERRLWHYETFEHFRQTKKVADPGNIEIMPPVVLAMDPDQEPDLSYNQYKQTNENALKSHHELLKYLAQYV